MNKNDLLTKLRENRKAHVAEFVAAEKAHRLAVITELRKMLIEISEGGAVRTDAGLKPPVSHAHDYDIAIDMLEWSKAEQVVVSSGQFRQYVRDEWDWKRAFKNETSRYLGGL